tara:strand:- start:143 stop:814 length:672 start_codon:yes stop_codon:yes gene_type:complete
MLIVIEGNIGVGKSTIAYQLAEHCNFKLFEEGADTNEAFKQYLQLYYKDPSRWALEMQFWLMSQRFKQHQEALSHIHTTGQCCIMDRSIYGDTVFAQRNYLDGHISELGYKSYLAHRDVMLRFLMVPQLTIYLDASPTICAERIKLRSRTAEAGIPLEYLEGLENLYRDLMQDMEDMGSRVEFIDWSEFQSPDKVYEFIRGYNESYRWQGFRKTDDFRPELHS